MKISQNVIATPQYTYSGAEECQANPCDRWLEVEAQFSSTPEFTDELTFKYFILFHGKLLTGEVTHVNILAGRENHSVMYVAPRSLAGFHGEPGGGSLTQQNKIFSPFLLAFFFF